MKIIFGHAMEGDVIENVEQLNAPSGDTTYVWRAGVEQPIRIEPPWSLVSDMYRQERSTT